MDMRRKIELLFIAALFLVSCGGEEKRNDTERPSRETLISNIKVMEDSLKGLTSQLKDIKQIPNLTRMELINRYLEFYKFYPEDDFAPECLDKVHMVYSGMNVHSRSAQYADTLLIKYPEYINRAMVLESQGSTFDIFLQPRDSAKVRYYYELLLKEYPDLDKEKRQGIKERLKYNHLNFDQYLEMKMNEIASK
jgi:hypothetical protein